MQRFKGVASGKQSFREHCATKWFLEANPRNISASKISRYTVLLVLCNARERDRGFSHRVGTVEVRDCTMCIIVTP